MTRYTVVWDEDVEAAFIDEWIAVNSQKRAVLNEIASWIDKNLAEDPDKSGQARPELGSRTTPVPLSSSPARVSVTFEVWPEERQVRVIRLTMRDW